MKCKQYSKKYLSYGLTIHTMPSASDEFVFGFDDDIATIMNTLEPGMEVEIDNYMSSFTIQSINTEYHNATGETGITVILHGPKGDPYRMYGLVDSNSNNTPTLERKRLDGTWKTISSGIIRIEVTSDHALLSDVRCADIIDSFR